MNKESAIRRRIASTYNKTEDDFPSLRAYNDYLEEVEDITFNLIEGVNVQETEAKIKAYQEENADQIIASRAKRAEVIALALRKEKGASAAAQGPSLEKAQESLGATGIQLGASGAGQYVPSLVAGSMFMQPMPMGPIGSRPVPVGCQTGEAAEDLEAQKIREQMGARAGGWTAEVAQRRALDEAMCSLWILPLVWIGDEYAARAPEVHAFGYVLNITEEVEKCTFLAEDVQFERFPIIDIGGKTQQKKMLGFFTDTSALIERGVASGRRVLVHCVEGRQRSCAVVAAYLILSMGLTSLEAIDHIRKIRPEAFKNSRFGVGHVNFESALEQWEETLGSTSSSTKKMEKLPPARARRRRRRTVPIGAEKPRK